MKPAWRAWLRMTLVLAWLAGGGCAAWPDTEDFEVTLVNVAQGREMGGGLGEATLTFTIRLQNASPSPVTLTGGAHKLYLNGVYVGQGLSNERVEVPRLGTRTENLTVHLSTFKLARAVYGIYRAQKVSYRVASTLYGDATGRSRTFRTNKEGEVDLSGLNLPPPPAGVPVQ
jgi:LEA14-like dessication related protein